MALVVPASSLLVERVLGQQPEVQVLEQQEVRVLAFEQEALV